MKNRIALMASLLAIGSTAALAGDGAPGWLDGWTVGIGGAQIHKRLTMEDLQGPFTPPGLKLGVDTSSTLMLSLSRRDRKSTRLNSSHLKLSRMPSSA